MPTVKVIGKVYSSFDVKAVSAPIEFMIDSGRLVFTRDSNGKLSGCNVSGGSVKDLTFEKVN